VTPKLSLEDIRAFGAAVWASLVLCVFYSLEDHLPRYRTETTVESWSSDALAASEHNVRWFAWAT
jgi:hypothetical protein